MQVKVVIPSKEITPKIFTNNEVASNPGVYRSQSYDEQFLVSLDDGNVLHVVGYKLNQNVRKWEHRDDKPMWIKETNPLTITFQGD